MAPAVDYYRQRFGFEARHESDAFSVITRDDAAIHLWLAGDQGWRGNRELVERPIISGAESFLAGTASCRIEVVGVDALFEELRAADVLHPAAGERAGDTDFGTREFPTLDLDGNLLTFFEWRTAP